MKKPQVPNSKSQIPWEVHDTWGLGIEIGDFFRTSVFLFAVSFFISCKPPLPVYFDTPIGIKAQGFDTSIAGNYIPLDDVIEKGTKEFSEKYDVKYDKILPKDTTLSLEADGNNMNYEEVKDIIGTTKGSGKMEFDNPKFCDSLFHALCKFNELIAAKIGLNMDKQGASRSKTGMIKITYDRVFFISVDSAGNNTRDTLISLSPSVLLTRYSGNYFLNFKTEYGWEIMQLEVWEKDFLSVRPFYFTGYDKCAKTVSELILSTKSIYPNLNPVLNKGKKVIGFKAILNPKLLREKFRKSEEVMLLLKIK